ncbi:MAG: EAL domain-containing protein [Acidimicrobiales bacterium]
MRHSRWLSSGVALAVVAALYSSAVGFGGFAWLQLRSADDRLAEQGWLHLSKARLDILGATDQLEADLRANVSATTAATTFAASRAKIEQGLDDITVTPELTRSVNALRQIIRAVPAGGSSSAARLRVSSGQVATQIGQLAEQSPLDGELAFADRLVVDMYRLQIASRLVDAETASTVDQSFGLALATDMTRDSDDQIWRFGSASIAGSMPAGYQAKLAALTTSEDARVVQDAARWAAARSGIGGDGGGVARPDAAAADAASDRLSDALIAMGTETLTTQTEALRLDEESANSMAVNLLYVIIGSVAAATIILLLRRNRSRINDDELRVAASTDRLTGLGNRAHLDAEVGLLAERSPEVVLMHIDLDHFKPVNDTYGHAVGDRVLQISAERLKAVAAEHEGIAARLGGDEFVLVLPSITQELVDEITHALLSSLQAFQIGGLDLTVGASIGVARGVGEVTDLLINADLALYQAKRTGRGQASTFRAEAAAFVSFVRDALMEGRVQVVYQPQVSLRDGRCIGAEVLARLVDRTGSLVPAKEWLGIAEWLGVTGELFEHVVSAVCEDLKSGPPLHTQLWFNVAPNDLIRPGGPEWVLTQLARLKLPVSRLGIELTETEAITDPARLAVVLERLRSVGLGLALDDFGARNTPIGHLVDLPVTRVKLDASLIAGIGEDMPPSSWVVKAMAELATRLRIEVMAEGVTSGHQVSLLAKLGVPAAQGYLLGLPGPVDRIPNAVNIGSLLHSSLNGFEAGTGVGPLVQTSGPRSTADRGTVERSGVDRRR